MKSSRALTGALIVGSVAIASMFAAAPASAATLPPGQKITVIDTSTDQFYNVDPADAFATPVGTPPALISEFEAGVDVDDSGLGYAIANGSEVEQAAEKSAETVEEEVAALAVQVDYSTIYKADANTGLLSDGKRVVIDAGGEVPPPANWCSAIDYSKSVILAVCDIYYGESATAYIGTIDVSGATALLTPFNMLSGVGYMQLRAIAVNPVDGVIWGFENAYSTTNVYRISRDNVYPSFVGEDEEYFVEAADFDRSGQLWLSVAPFGSISRVADFESVFSLATFDFATNQAVVVAPYGSNVPYEISYPAALTVWGALAATGATMSIAPAIAASGILLLGALLAAGTMVLRRRNAQA